jgi:hypothetical protein
MLTTLRSLALMICVLCLSSVVLTRAQFPTSDSARQAPPRFDTAEGMLAWYQRTTEDAIRRIRPKLWGSMTAEQRRIESEISFVVDPRDDVALAEASSTGPRTVRISVGFMRSLETLIEAQVFSAFRDDTTITRGYYQYLADAIADNQRKITSKMPPSPIKLFPQWMGWSETQRRRYWDDPKIGRAYNVEGGLAFLIAHEIGHHVFRHRPYREKSSEQARLDETQSDTFAVEAIAKAEYNPLSATPLLFLWIFQGSNPAEQEGSSTHPADERRLLNVFRFAEETVRNDPDFEAYLRRNNLIERWQNAQREMRQATTELAKIAAASASSANRRAAFRFAR